ncbi:hypothetical protein CR513_61947, partial [Mucuna pruriens]
MGHASVVIDLDDYDMSENRKGPDSEDYRLERRWKRRELSNISSKHNHCDSGTRSAVKSDVNVTILTSENGDMSGDEMDEDYKVFLVTYNPDIDVVSGGNVDGSGDDINIGYNSDHNDHLDSQYRMFLENYREEERLDNDPKLDTEMLNGSKQRDETGYQEIKRSSSVRKQTVGLMKSEQNLEAKRGCSKKRPREDIFGVPKSNCHVNRELDVVDEDYQIFLNSYRIEDDYRPIELIGRRSKVMKNSRVFDHAFDTPEALIEVDEDYQLFLNTIRIVDGEVECMHETNTSKIDKVDVDGDSNSSDSDLILLEPNQIHENTPFVSSKAYHSSWFETEMNPRDSWQLSSCDHSQFRRRLMNDLQRPYDQGECDRLLHVVHQKRAKERHIETRRGVVKSYRTKGVNKSYLDLYPGHDTIAIEGLILVTDLAKAIAEFKQPKMVLFLLRGFIFWLQNLTHEGIFQPWVDKSCLMILRKM